MKRVVPDTNIVVSAVQFGGLPETFLEIAYVRAFHPITSVSLLDELDETLRDRFAWPATRLETLRTKLLATFDVASPVTTINFIKDDPDDDRVLEAAVAGRADYIVSGDKHLLKLGE